MNTIFMNSEKGKTRKPHVLVLKFTNKLDFRRGKKVIALSNLNIHYTLKNIKRSYNNNNAQISAPTSIDILNYQMILIPYQILKIILSLF